MQRLSKLLKTTNMFSQKQLTRKIKFTESLKNDDSLRVFWGRFPILKSEARAENALSGKRVKGSSTILKQFIPHDS